MSDPARRAPGDTARRALAVSPHLDDAVFSAGALLARLARDGWQVTVCTVFTRSVPHPSGFALACQLDKGLQASVDYLALRRAEDAAALAVLGAAPDWLDLPEAPHRGYDSAAALFTDPREDDAGVVEAAAGRLREAIGRSRPHLVLACQAVGGHVDHVQAVRALDRVRPAVPTLWWTDFPYAARPAAAQRRPLAARFAALTRLDHAPDEALLALKRDACLAYVSQCGFQFGGAAGLERLLAGEGRIEPFAAEALQQLP